MTSHFSTILIEFDGASAERQIYVVREGVTEAQIRSGDDAGVVCLILDESKAELIAELLNREASDG